MNEFDSYIVSAGTADWGQTIYDEHKRTWKAAREKPDAVIRELVAAGKDVKAPDYDEYFERLDKAIAAAETYLKGE